MPVGDYLVGLCWLAVTLGGVGLGAWLVGRQWLAGIAVSARVMGYAQLVTAGLVLVHLVPGALGLLTRGSVALASCALLAGAAAWARTAARNACAREVPDGTSSGTPSPARADALATRLAAGAAVAAVGVAALFVFTYLLDQRGIASVGIDTLTFEVPGIARWIQEGSIWPVHQHWFGWAFGNYPQNGELVMLTGILPFHSDAFLRLEVVPFLCLSGVGTYALARELGAAWAPAAAAGAALVAIPTSLITTLFHLKPDPIMVTCFLGGALFLTRHARTRSTTDLVFGGLGLGLAVGTKWYGLSYAAVVAVVWVVAHLAARERPSVVARRLVALAAVAGAAAGFWFLRNLVGSDNPVFPVKVEVFGITLFDAPRDWRRESIGFPLAHYVDSPGLIRDEILPKLRDQLALAGALAVCGLIAGLAVRRAGWRMRWIALGGLGVLVVYTLTPYTAQGFEGQPEVFPAARYALPGLAAGLAVAAALPRSAGARAAVAVLALIATIDGVALADDSVWRASRWLPALAVVVAGSLLLAWWRGRPAPRPAVAGSLVFAVVAVTATVGFVHADRYQENRYLGLDPSIDWVTRNAPAGHRIGIAGEGPPSHMAPIAVLPFAGPRFGNEVEVMGREVRHQFNELRGREDFVRQVRERGYDMLVIMLRSPETSAPETTWARPLGFRRAVRGKTAEVLVRDATNADS